MTLRAETDSHVFITQCNLAHLDTDAWLLPTSATCCVTKPWRDSVSKDELKAIDGFRALRPSPLSRNGVRVCKLSTVAGAASGAWLTNVGGGKRSEVEWYLDGVSQFFDAVESHFKEHPPISAGRRSRPLVGVPVVGTGQGGASDRKGMIASKLLPRLYEEAKRRPFDIVLATFGPAMFGAAQLARRDYLEDKGSSSQLSAELDEKAADLASLALKGQLVLFIGAGVSAGAGLPGWKDLLLELAGAGDSQPDSFGKLDMLDQAQIIERRLKGKAELGARVVQIIDRTKRYSLGHSLLANLPVNEVATTNYDTLFELASEDANRDLSVLRYKPADDKPRWLLKMHGCVSRAEDIVLTRSDYLRYHSDRAALAGIVQALLVTKRMLFVGFSLSDANFHRIAHEVRLAMRPGPENASDLPFATALTLQQDDFFKEIWDRDVALVPMTVNLATSAAARQLDVFLDTLLAKCSVSTLHLLQQEFDDLLGPGEKALKGLLMEFQAGVTDAMKESAAWDRVQRMLYELGANSPTNGAFTGSRTSGRNSSSAAE